MAEFDGILAGRTLQALGQAKGDALMAAAKVRRSGWLDSSEIEAFISKAAVAAVDSGDVDTQLSSVSADFVSAARESSLIARLSAQPGMPYTRIYSMTPIAGSRVTEGGAIKATFRAMPLTAIRPIQHAALMVLTDDVLEQAQRAGVTLARWLAQSLATASTDAEDATFLNASDSASILFGLTPIASTGSTAAQILADIGNLIDRFVTFGGDLRFATLVMTPGAATHLGLLLTTGGSLAFPNIGVNGGTLAGLPTLTSRGASVVGASPAESVIVLVDRSRLWTWRGNSELDTSNETALQMDDSPTQSSVTTVAATSVVSMFQANSTALKAVISAGWHCAPGGAQFLDGVDY